MSAPLFLPDKVTEWADEGAVAGLQPPRTCLLVLIDWISMKTQSQFIVAASVASLVIGGLSESASAQTRLSEWERGVSVDSQGQPDMRVYLWFYEWHMFGAVLPGQHTKGTWENEVHVERGGLAATIESANPGLSASVRAVADGAELNLRVTNESDREWPPLASIIACFNPGPKATRNRQFVNTKSWFHAADGLQPLAMRAPREIHYNSTLREAINQQSTDGKFVWSNKWPASDVDAVDGLIIRESGDGNWVTGIAWNRFLSAQGHNPWECMHLSAHLGPLKPQQTRVVPGRIWLFKGDREELLSRYQRWKAEVAERFPEQE